MGLSLFAPTFFTLTSVVFSIFLIYIILKYARKSLKCFKQMNDKSLRYSFLFVLAAYLVLYFLYFPGFMGSDDVNMTKTVMNGRAWEWQSLSYSFLTAAGVLIFGQFGFLPLLAIGYFGYLSIKMLSIIDELKTKPIYKKITGIVFVLLSLHPFMQGMLLTYTRDIVYSLMLTHLSIMLYAKTNWSAKDLAWLSGFLVFFADLRQESLLYLIVVPLVLGLAKILNFQQLKVYFLFTATAIFLYFYVAPKVYETQSYNANYEVTAYVHPLSYVLHNNGKESYDPQDIAAIDRVFSVEKLIKNYTPLDIGPFHSGGFNQNTNEEDWKKFKIAAQNIILQSKLQILNSRFKLFMCTLNLCEQGGGIPFYDVFRDSPQQVQPILVLMMKSVYDYKLNETSQSYFNAIQDFYTWTGVWRFFNNLSVPLLFIIFGLLLFNRYPEYFRASAVVAARLPAVFLLAPASYFKYIFSIQLFFTLFFPLVLLTYIASKNELREINE
jgi:hypothetical protein